MTTAPSGMKPYTRDLSDIPSYSMKERDRRWNFLRQLMRDNDLKAILIPAPQNYIRAAESVETWITNDIGGMNVIFPVDGEPRMILRKHFMAGQWIEGRLEGESIWVDDIRLHRDVVHVLKEMNLTNERIGTITRPWPSPGSGRVYELWSSILNGLPNVTWVELWDQFVEFYLTKSEEELAVFRHAAALTEAGCQAMLETARAGVSEAEIFGAVKYAVERHGGRVWELLLTSGPHCLAWGAARWRHRPQQPRVLQDGDIVLTEFFVDLASTQTQCPMGVAIGNVSDEVHRLADICRESYEIAVKGFRAGEQFLPVTEAMRAPMEREGAWHPAILAHTMNPQSWEGPHPYRVEDMAAAWRQASGQDTPFKDMDLYIEELGKTYRTTQYVGGTLKPGMCLQLEPSAYFGPTRMVLGGNAIVSPEGDCEELNSLPTRLNFVD